MLKKSDILPLILAFISTAFIVGVGFFLFTKINTTRLSGENEVNTNNLNNSGSKTQLDSPSSKSSAEASIEDQEVFVMPVIVPEGTAVIINGSSKMNQINQALRKGFLQKFPRTAITTYTDGNKLGIDLLISGDIDVAAIDRPLSETEKAAGLAAMMINNSMDEKDSHLAPKFYYAYQKPVKADVKAFLGYVLSPEGQRAINQR